LINFTNPTRGSHEVPLDMALRFSARDDHEMHMTSLVSLVIWTERSGSLIVAATGRPQSVVQGSSLALCSNTC
jgi:hypothetical protein